MHENRPVLLFDIDDVLAFFLKGFWEQVATRYPQVIVPSLELCDSYNLCTPESGLTPEMMHSIFAQPHFFRNLEVDPASIAVMKQIQDANANAFICSAPYVTNPTCASDKVAWVGEYFGNWWQERTILTMDKTLVRGDYLFDDKPNITGVHTPSWQHVVWDQSYNRECEGLRVYNWETAYEFIRSLP